MPPTCNVGLNPVYSNPYPVTVSGTGNATNVFVAGTGTANVVPIDASSNTVSATQTLANNPNSAAVLPLGTRVYYGSSNGLNFIDTSTNTPGTANSSFTGKALAVPATGTKLLDAEASLALIVDLGTNAATPLTFGGATAGAFTIDAFKAFMVNGATLGVFSGTQSLRTLPLAAPANDVAFLPQSTFAYLAGGAPNAITVRAVCDNSLQGTIPTGGGTPQFIDALPNGSGVVAVESGALDVMSVTISGAGCIPSQTSSLQRIDLGAGGFTPKQLLVSNDSKDVYVVSDLPFVLRYNRPTGAVSRLGLNTGATPLSAGLTLDGTQLWVGGSDQQIHRVNTTNGADEFQSNVGFAPDLVVVRPK